MKQVLATPTRGKQPSEARLNPEEGVGVGVLRSVGVKGKREKGKG